MLLSIIYQPNEVNLLFIGKYMKLRRRGDIGKVRNCSQGGSDFEDSYLSFSSF